MGKPLTLSSKKGPRKKLNKSLFYQYVSGTTTVASEDLDDYNYRCSDVRAVKETDLNV